MQTLDSKVADCGCGKAHASIGAHLVDATIACMACGHRASVSVPLVEARDPLAQGIYRCDECGARMAYGKLLLREVIEPYVDDHGIQWLRRRFQDPKTKTDILVVDVDPRMAATVAREILALVIP